MATGLKDSISGLCSPTVHFRQDFCVQPLGEDGILMTGGYDDLGHQTRTDLYNVTSGQWHVMRRMPRGRGVHACGE